MDLEHLAIKQFDHRLNLALEESDSDYFSALLLKGEMLTKLITLSIVACLEDDKDRNRYRLEHALVHAHGLGEWPDALDDALTGQATHFLAPDAHDAKHQLAASQKQPEWQHAAVKLLSQAADRLGIDHEEIPIKTDLRRWFRLFSQIRNKTRGHGAVAAQKASLAAFVIRDSLNLIISNFCLLKRPWAYLHRNLSGKYRVSPVCGDPAAFSHLKRETSLVLPNGLYIAIPSIRRVPLLGSDPELQDFYFANGGFTASTYECLSYSTGSRETHTSEEYLLPPSPLPASDTRGRVDLDSIGRSFTNAPRERPDYVSRPNLESELVSLLLDDRHPVLTLRGRGGIGKTSLALRVLEQVYESGRFDLVVWFSARDVDLTEHGPKPVAPDVLSPKDISAQYASLVLPIDKRKDKAFRAQPYLESQLQKSEIGPTLFVFDNFETIANPAETYAWLDTFIRLPNKILITTRLSDFRGDYPVEVKGMEDAEARQLVQACASRLAITELLTKEYTDKLISDAAGHPYVIKVILGDVQKQKRRVDVPRIVSGADDILTALFERTYAAITPCAQRTFLTLAAWNSSVPRVALEAVLLHSTQEPDAVADGVEMLIAYSMAETHESDDKQIFIRLPLVASVFGKKKLKVSPLRAGIQSDVDILQLLGPSRAGETNLTLSRRLERFIQNVSDNAERGIESEVGRILETVCAAYPPGWLLIARWQAEMNTAQGLLKAKSYTQRYLQAENSASGLADGWRMMSALCFRSGDKKGQAHARLEQAKLIAPPFHELSNIALLINQFFREESGRIDPEERRHFAADLAQMMHDRAGEANADDLSRMAWLSLNLHDEHRARAYVERGLSMERHNAHCVNLAERFGILQ
jgi:hypothetical protein